MFSTPTLPADACPCWGTKNLLNIYYMSCSNPHNSMTFNTQGVPSYVPSSLVSSGCKVESTPSHKTSGSLKEIMPLCRVLGKFFPSTKSSLVIVCFILKCFLLTQPLRIYETGTKQKGQSKKQSNHTQSVAQVNKKLKV